jgi:hypothetical protein
MNEELDDRIFLLKTLIEIYDRELLVNRRGIFRGLHSRICLKCQSLEKQRKEMVMELKKMVVRNGL